MGRGIVYCGDCGKRLTDTDFERGQAVEIEYIPYCAECRPEAVPPPPPQEQKFPSSGQWRAARKRSSSRALPIVPEDVPPPPHTRRRMAPASQGSGKFLLIGGLVGGAVLVILLVALLSGGGGSPSTTARTESSVERPVPGTSKIPPTQDHKREFDRLTAFAATSRDPDEILFRCDAARRKLRGTPYEFRVAEIEDKARGLKKKRDVQRRFDVSLADVKKMMKGDSTFRREKEVVRLLTSLKAVAGDRSPEIEGLLKTYQDRRVLGRIETARKIWEADTALEKEDDVLDLLEGAIDVGGPHQAAARSALADYEKHRIEGRFREAARIRAADPDFKEAETVRALLEEVQELSAGSAARAKKELAEYEKARVDRMRGKRIGPFRLDAKGYIHNWLVVGPFPNGNHVGFEKDYLGGEASVEPGNLVPVRVAGEPEREWRATHSRGESLWLSTVFGGRNWVVAYAACWVESEADRDVEIRLGSDDGFKAWFDGKLLGAEHVHRPNQADKNKYPVRLRKGRQLFLIKVAQGDGGWEFQVRIVTPDGKKAPGVSILN